MERVEPLGMAVGDVASPSEFAPNAGPVRVTRPSEVVDPTVQIPSDLGDFVMAHYPGLLRRARLVCRDGADAGDAVQAALEQAWRNRSSLRDPAAMAAWLDRIVVREAIRIARHRERWWSRSYRLDPDVEDRMHGPAGSEPSIDGTRLRLAFDRLPAQQRAVVALHLHLGYTVAETASIVEAPVETVRSRLRLATARLRSDLGEARS